MICIQKLLAYYRSEQTLKVLIFQYIYYNEPATPLDLNEFILFVKPGLYNFYHLFVRRKFTTIPVGEYASRTKPGVVNKRIVRAVPTLNYELFAW